MNEEWNHNILLGPYCVTAWAKLWIYSKKKQTEKVKYNFFFWWYRNRIPLVEMYWVQFLVTVALMEGVCIGSYHHGDFLQRISSSSELGPVHSVLVTAAVMTTAVPHAVQVGMSTGVIPPSSLLVVGTVTCRHKHSSKTTRCTNCWMSG